jgi:predicted anti-sigma-YlaC factor YlaD
MNCEKCQDLISDLIDGSLDREDQVKLNLHLEDCLECGETRNDLQSIVGFCRTHRGEYAATPNEKALWQRIRNMIETGPGAAAMSPAPSRRRLWSNWVGRSWELSFPQLAASAAAIVLVVSLSTVVGLKRFQGGDSAKSGATSSPESLSMAAAGVRDRVAQQQQMIAYWNKRVEYNKARWSPEMRATFDRNLSVIDQTVNESLNTLTQNPHDEVSEELLNTALNEKLSILKEFAEL